MSCENTNARLQIKYTTVAGQVPTIPSTNDHNDGTWNPTDIYIGEFFLNSYDDLLWVRTLDGILAVGGTGGSASFIGDFVSKANGGTYSGPIFAPTMSTPNLLATTISATAIDATIFGSTPSLYYGDGSNLTGITTVWNGGTVALTSTFNDYVEFQNGLSVGNISNLGNPIYVNDDTVFSGNVSASYFIGDGSLITNLPIGPTANDYTTSAYLDGNIIRYDRTDLANAYSVDLSPILFTQSVASFGWNSATNDATIYINDGSFFTINLGIFNNISTAIINATDVYANNFYGTFNGTYSNDIYTISATLSGTDAVFLRTDGITYSLDLSTFGGGGTGSAGTLEQTLVLGNTIGTQSINFGGSANISANGTNIELKAEDTVLGDIYLNSLNVADDFTSGIEQIAFSSVGPVQLTSNFTLIPGQEQETHQKMDGGLFQQNFNQKDFKSTFELITDLAQDTEYRRVLGVEATTSTNGSLLKAIDNTSSTETEIKTTLDTITLQSTNTSITDFHSKLQLEATTLSLSAEDVTGQFQTGLFVSTPSVGSLDALDSSTGNNGVVGVFVNGFTYVGGAYLSATDGTSTYFSQLAVYPNEIKVNSSNPAFAGIEYDNDYSSGYTNRSLVDKAYVDSLVTSATGSVSLSSVLLVGNSAGSTNINMNSNNITGISSLGNGTGTTIEMINIINMANLALMYNT